MVHRWRSQVGQPQSDLERHFDFMRGWQHAVMLPTGDLLAIVNRGYLLKMDWNSKLLWQRKLQIHHDVSFDSEGRIYALTEQVRYIRSKNRLILDNVLQILNAAGENQISISPYDLLQGHQRFRSMLNEQIAQRFAVLENSPLRKTLSGQFWTPNGLAMPKRC